MERHPVDEPVPVDEAWGHVDAEFAFKLGEVVWRLKALGYQVRIVETWRSQARQDHLWLIGRTIEKNKPVVTHTRDSKHTEGKAADLCEARDGWGNASFFRNLDRYARELGLCTPDGDGGHVEAY